ncbi:PIN domain-containing protein [Euzebya tangerina]|uniref:PIN domain-containing protein n=1 Tax=Euzebya tangerina TaxID=591198 RepID=UPI00196AE463|nr:PIN domain-containing protein [Euzebya tangerina]
MARGGLAERRPAGSQACRAVVAGLVGRHQITGNLVPDAMLAALALEHGLTVYSADTDFARFDELNWVHPLWTGS